MVHNIESVDAFIFGSYRLDVLRHRLSYKGEPVVLPPLTFDILKILVERHGHVVSKQDLMRGVWSERYVEENNLTVRMSALRKALARDADERFIETIPTNGYRFVGDVKEVSREMESADTYHSIAVLPPISKIDQKPLDYLCTSIAESLIDSLSQIANLRVMAPTVISRYRSKDLDPQEVGRKLGVRMVLTITLTPAAREFVVDMELLDVRDGAYLWGAKYRCGMSKLGTLQEKIASEVTPGLSIRLNDIARSKFERGKGDDL
jgi:DNA-binding winged helix-turn-helix (wHTH) protein